MLPPTWVTTWAIHERQELAVAQDRDGDPPCPCSVRVIRVAPTKLRSLRSSSTPLDQHALPQPSHIRPISAPTRDDLPLAASRTDAAWPGSGDHRLRTPVPDLTRESNVAETAVAAGAAAAAVVAVDDEHRAHDSQDDQQASAEIKQDAAAARLTERGWPGRWWAGAVVRPGRRGRARRGGRARSARLPASRVSGEDGAARSTRLGTGPGGAGCGPSGSGTVSLSDANHAALNAAMSVPVAAVNASSSETPWRSCEPGPRTLVAVRPDEEVDRGDRLAVGQEELGCRPTGTTRQGPRAGSACSLGRAADEAPAMSRCSPRTGTRRCPRRASAAAVVRVVRSPRWKTRWVSSWATAYRLTRTPLVAGNQTNIVSMSGCASPAMFSRLARSTASHRACCVVDEQVDRLVERRAEQRGASSIASLATSAAALRKGLVARVPVNADQVLLERLPLEAVVVDRDLADRPEARGAVGAAYPELVVELRVRRGLALEVGTCTRTSCETSISLCACHVLAIVPGCAGTTICGSSRRCPLDQQAQSRSTVPPSTPSIVARQGQRLPKRADGGRRPERWFCGQHGRLEEPPRRSDRAGQGGQRTQRSRSRPLPGAQCSPAIRMIPTPATCSAQQPVRASAHDSPYETGTTGASCARMSCAWL